MTCHTPVTIHSCKFLLKKNMLNNNQIPTKVFIEKNKEKNISYQNTFSIPCDVQVIDEAVLINKKP